MNGIEQHDAVARNNDDFASLVDHAPDIIVRYDRQYRHLYVNKAVEQATGMARQAFIGKTNRELGMPDELCDFWDSINEAVFASGAPQTIEFTFPSANGMHDYQARLAPEFDASGAVATVIAVTRDVTEQRRAEARLQLLAHASEILDASMHYDETLPPLAALVTEKLADMCVITLTDAEGTPRHIALVQRGGLAPDTATLFAQFYGDGQEPAAGPARVLHTGMIEQWHTSADAPAPLNTPQQCAARDQLGIAAMLALPIAITPDVVGTLCLARLGAAHAFDPTDAMLAMELARRVSVRIEHARLYHEAQAGIYEREAFLSIASHELRNPLTTLLGRAQLLIRRAARDTTFSARNLHDLQIIADQSLRVNAMLDELLDLSRIGTGQFAVDHAPLDMAALLRRVVTEVQPTLQQHTLYLHGAAQPMVLLGDAMRLEQVFRNLLGNAIKYSPDGGPITITAQRQDATLTICVEDSGVGISPEALPYLFQRFYRAPAASKYAVGSGIGLYVVREIVQQHHGNISVSSVLGQGSVFTVRLPVLV